MPETEHPLGSRFPDYYFHPFFFCLLHFFLMRRQEAFLDDLPLLFDNLFRTGLLIKATDKFVQLTFLAA